MHRYQSFENKLAKLHSDFAFGGLRAVIRRVFRYASFRVMRLTSPLIIATRRRSLKHGFEIAGRKFEYFLHSSNLTWSNERCVELPVVLDYINHSDGNKVLEIGAVLRQYVRPKWIIVDKFENGIGILNQDIELFFPPEKYDLIVSISTFEHIGIDDEIRDEPKVERAIKHVMRDLLKPDGTFVMTAPLGYNKYLDDLIFRDTLGFTSSYFLRKEGKIWREVDVKDVHGCTYGARYAGAGELYIGVFCADAMRKVAPVV